MTNFIPTQSSTLNPKWTGRNKQISKFIENNTNVLDLGCGSKDLLNYLRPKKYVGVDYKQPLCDIEINLNTNFVLPDGPWDYLVASGVLEYLDNLENFFSKINSSSEKYIFTFWKLAHKSESIKNKNLQSLEYTEKLIEKYFDIIDTDKFRNHVIFICKNKNV